MERLATQATSSDNVTPSLVIILNSRYKYSRVSLKINENVKV